MNELSFAAVVALAAASSGRRYPSIRMPVPSQPTASTGSPAPTHTQWHPLINRPEGEQARTQRPAEKHVNRTQNRRTNMFDVFAVGGSRRAGGRTPMEIQSPSHPTLHPPPSTLSRPTSLLIYHVNHFTKAYCPLISGAAMQMDTGPSTLRD